MPLTYWRTDGQPVPPGRKTGQRPGLRPFGPETVHRTVSETGLTPQWGGRRAPPGQTRRCTSPPPHPAFAVYPAPPGGYTPPMNDMTGDPAPHETAEPLHRALGERYLTYALSTIMHRALPDARDGLKPVHRRILYAMRELRLGSDGAFRKSAKISGDVMGNYHPHGDAAIYDAMARLAQDFAVRYPLVDGQGNFGNIDGDNPAASRYTEARMTPAAEALLEGIAENAVDFRENYDGTLTEPVVLPAAFPNLLANGASGIAVGMATNVPPTISPSCATPACT